MKIRRCFPTIVLISALLVQVAFAQKIPVREKKTATSTSASGKKYPSLLWEITGNGLKKPSWLFGTMHVSDKLAFHLGDSFYDAIRRADVVALETNPESWQDDFSRSTMFTRRSGRGYRSIGGQNEFPMDRMMINLFALDSYEELIKASLSLEPSMINGMLYRTFGNNMDDFEEDTFLDMYIFQVGKKLGKRISGVENFEQSEKLVAEAYRDMARDRHKKRKSYDYGGMGSSKKLEDAYRKGDLDLLDSIQVQNTVSDAFQEKFLYRRNEIQAGSIDSIIRKASLFVGVGAAHLPGERGVIEILRSKGYTVRPVLMGDRNSIQKEAIDKIRVDHSFNMQTSDDGFYQVSIPGKKFYQFTNWSGMNVVQYADMVNGAYYLVTRIRTNSSNWGHTTGDVYKKIDSYLYENIPGKIIRKTAIMKNGYRGFDILNKTRRGDYQRYQLFITPFEVVLFKISGNGDFVSSGQEANRFFNSIRLKEYSSGEWLGWQPSTGGFSVQLPHAPAVIHDINHPSRRFEYAAYDAKDSTSFLILQANLHNYMYLEEDSFELNLMDESYAFSGFIEQPLERGYTTVSGYPALNRLYKHKDGSFSAVKFIIRGPVYYALIARYRKENPGVQKFLRSFAIISNNYPLARQQTDTSMHFSVRSPVPLTNEKPGESERARLEEMVRSAAEELEDDGGDPGYANRFRSRIFGNDSTGEKITVAYSRFSEYTYWKDSSRLWKYIMRKEDDDEPGTFVYLLDKEFDGPNGMKCKDLRITDTGSSRLMLARLFYKDGHIFSISTLTDTLSASSGFLKSFFESFKPADTLQAIPMFVRKSQKFMNALFGTDSLLVARTAKNSYEVEFDSLDVPLLKTAISSLHWDIPQYLELKTNFIRTLGTLHHPSIVPWLKDLYWKAGDTAELQHPVLNALLLQRNKEGFQAFRELILQEPPISESVSWINESASPLLRTAGKSSLSHLPKRYRKYEYGSNLHILADTLALTRTLFPDLLQLLNLDDYRTPMLYLLRQLKDSGYLKGTDYESYMARFYLDGKQLLKKQLARENKERMEKAGRKDLGFGFMAADEEDESDCDEGNDELMNYAALLLPFRDDHPGIQKFFRDLMTSGDRKLLYECSILLLENKKLVPDSFFINYARLDRYRGNLYHDLDRLGLIGKFPTAFKTQEQIARSIVTGATSGYYNKPDTLVYVDKLPVTYKNKKGFVHFFKYKEKRDDEEWKLASVGMQPEDQQKIDLEDDEFTEHDDRELENDQPIEKQIQEMLKEMINKKRPSATEFYDARSVERYRRLLPEVVKSRRYRD